MLKHLNLYQISLCSNKTDLRQLESSKPIKVQSPTPSALMGFEDWL
ncbi:hypothetical protein HMPREF9103_00058 [Lentilactobacillus parafarraginis F0439]|uniref:Uncharacterized protein n=1 Tax=Lentilactobacillus parafarraginis F0439 TaxID=797515 RepID=G9ZK12_9LACO|nr:hypothetical protein HMPREF9103_00058 [Lentilactobacillus parafarraginis F0439]